MNLGKQSFRWSSLVAVCFVIAAAFAWSWYSRTFTADDIARDQFRQFVADPIPRSVQGLRCGPSLAVCPSLAQLLRFDVSQNDLAKILAAKSFVSADGNRIRSSELSCQPDCFALTAGETLYESDQGPYGCRVFCKVNSQRGEVTFALAALHSQLIAHDIVWGAQEKYLNPLVPRLDKHIDLVKVDAIAPRNAAETTAIQCLQHVGGTLLRDNALPEGPVTVIRLGLNELPSIDWDYLLFQPMVRDWTMRYVAAFPHLRELSLVDTEVSDGGFWPIENLQQLEYLHLERAQVREHGLKAVGKLTNLRHLDLNASKVCDRGLAYLSQLKNLETLDLRSTETGDAGLAAIGRIVSLRGLEIGWTNISDAGLQYLEHLTNLERLEMQAGILDTKFRDAALIHLRNLTRMRMLDLSSCDLSGAGLQHLCNMSSLESLDLSLTNLTDDGLRHLACLSNLTELSLRSTSGHQRVKGAGLVHLVGLTRLRRLDLSNTAINDDAVQYLGQMTNLEQLQVQQTKISEQGIRTLIGALPTTEVLTNGNTAE